MSKGINLLKETSFSSRAFRIVAIYLALSFIWIFLTDKLVFNFISDAKIQNLVSSIKGWFFVIATTLILYQLIKRALSEVKRVEGVIRESEHRYQTLANISPVGIFRTDANGNTTYVNPKWCEISGLFAQEAMGNGWLNAVHYEDKQKLSVNWKDTTSELGMSIAEYRFLHSDGTIVWVMGQAVPERNLDNQIIGYVGTITNITEQKHAFEELQKSQQEYRALSAHLQRIREDERAAIAREMHDELGQILTSLKMNIAFTRRELEESNTIAMKEKILKEFQSMNLTLDKAVSEVRKLITQLRPELLDKLGLIAALEWYSEEYEKTTKINCVFTSEYEELFLDHDIELAIFRIVQEAMTNTAKHSNAKSVQIRLSKCDDKLSIEIIDDGKGILESELEGTTSFGLMGMRERASLIGGNLEIFGVLGKGTTVRFVAGM